MNEIQFYSTINRIIRNDTGLLVLHLIQIFSMLIIALILLYNMIANGNLLECGVFKKIRRILK